MKKYLTEPNATKHCVKNHSFLSPVYIAHLSRFVVRVLISL